jgi:hypothetical protein
MSNSEAGIIGSSVYFADNDNTNNDNNTNINALSNDGTNLCSAPTSSSSSLTAPPCKFFLTPTGCWYGEMCRFSHNSSDIVQTYKLHPCGNVGCVKLCRGRQCRDCHFRRHLMIPTPQQSGFLPPPSFRFPFSPLSSSGTDSSLSSSQIFTLPTAAATQEEEEEEDLKVASAVYYAELMRNATAPTSDDVARVVQRLTMMQQPQQGAQAQQHQQIQTEQYNDINAQQTYVTNNNHNNNNPCTTATTALGAYDYTSSFKSDNNNRSSDNNNNNNSNEDNCKDATEYSTNHSSNDAAQQNFDGNADSESTEKTDQVASAFVSDSTTNEIIQMNQTGKVLLVPPTILDPRTGHLPEEDSKRKVRPRSRRRRRGSPKSEGSKQTTSPISHTGVKPCLGIKCTNYSNRHLCDECFAVERQHTVRSRGFVSLLR